MDPIEALKADHRNVEQLFGRFESDSDGSSSRQAIVNEIVQALTLHTAIEERVVYPFIRDHLPDLETRILEAFEEHAVVKNTLAELRRAKPRDERLDARMKVLKENVKHHVEEEENEILPELHDGCSDEQLTELAERMEEVRRSGARRRPAKRATSRKSSSSRRGSRRKAA